MSEPAIKLKGLTRRFGDLTAVSGLNLSVEKGEIFGLVGPDGAGKTTVMRMLTGILTPSEGTAEVVGFDINREGEALKKHIGYMSQRFGLYPDLTVMENLNFYADIYMVPRKEKNSRFERLLGFSNLTPFKDRPAGHLSGGMKQKLGLACALVHTPKVLFLDEPTNGVDPVSRRDFWRILYQLLKEGVTIFFSTAYLDEAERCSRLALMHKGCFLQVGSPVEVKQSIQAVVLQMSLSDSRAGRAVVQHRFPGLGFSLHGENIHVIMQKDEELKAELTCAMSEAGVTVHDCRIVDPLLEDVFIALTAKALTVEAIHE